MHWAYFGNDILLHLGTYENPIIDNAMFYEEAF